MNLQPVFDGHNDTLAECFSPETGEKRPFFQRSDAGQLDYPRALSGGFRGGLFAIFTPPPPDSPDRDMMSGVTFTDQGYEVSPRQPVEQAYAQAFTGAVLDYAHRLEASPEGKVGIVRSYADIPRFFEEGTLAMVLHIEGAEAIKEDLSNLEEYYRRDVRSLGLVWSRPNAFGDGVPFRFPSSPDTGDGLTRAGKELVRECSRLGILVDLAHINEKGFWDAARMLKTPLVVSHTAVHAICASSRNLTDAQIDAVGESGGLIGIMFEPMELAPSGRPDSGASLEDLIRHIDTIAGRIGIDHVGLGSDFDGADMPESLRDVSHLPDLVQALREKGYQGEDLDKITYQNWLRVLKGI
jgi:membrane dipeptidase